MGIFRSFWIIRCLRCYKRLSLVFAVLLECMRQNRIYFKYIRPFLSNVPIIHSPKTPKNLWFFGVSRRYGMGAFTGYQLKSSQIKSSYHCMKSAQTRSFLWSVFSRIRTDGLNTERYGVYIQS